MRATKANFYAKASALILALSCLSLQSSLAQTTKIDIASTASLFPQFYPLAIGEELGSFKDQNISIEELATGGGGATVQPVISGDTPIGLASMSATILAKLRNAPITVISGVTPNFLSTIVFAVAADSDLKAMADLTGKQQAKVGYTSGGSITDVASEVAVKAEKLTEGKDVIRVALGSMQAQTAALVTHQIQVAVVNVNAVAEYVTQGKIRIIGDTSSYLKNDEANAIIANSVYLKKNKDQVKRFLIAYSKAVDYGNAHKDAVQKLYVKKVSVTPEAAAIVFKALTWTTKLNYEGFVNELDLMKKSGKVKESVDPKQLYDSLVDLSLLP